MVKKTKKKNIKKQRPKLPYIWGICVALVIILGTLIVMYLSVGTPKLPDPPLKELAAAKGIELGMLANSKQITQKPFGQVLTSQYGMITSDGEMHWDKMRPSEGEYNFKKMDKLVDFAEAHNMAVQGHHLVWNEDDSLPKWLRYGEYSKEQLKQLLHDHITRIVGRYKGRVQEWTVVNEPFTRAKHMYGLDNWWQDQLGGGTEYIDDAFRWAHEADPSAKLILNDFYNETDTDVSRVMYAYIQGALARGVPIHGVGMQMHIDTARAPSKEALIKNMQHFKELGVPVYITEFDINSNYLKEGTKDVEQLEANVVADVARACIESGNCVSFTVFGMTDRQNFWQQLTGEKKRSNLFTWRYKPKLAFYSLRSAFEKS